MDKLRELARKLRESRRSWLELASEAVQNSLSYGEVCVALQEEGVSPPSEGYWANLVRLARWCVSLGLDLDLVSQAGVAKSRQISRIPFSSAEEAHEFLRWSVDKTLAQVKERVAETLSGSPASIGESFSSIRVPQSVHDLFTEARAKLSRVVGLELSETKTLEFLADFVLHMESGILRRVWLALHGEAEDRDVSSLKQVVSAARRPLPYKSL